MMVEHGLLSHNWRPAVEARDLRTIMPSVRMVVQFIFVLLLEALSSRPGRLHLAKLVEVFGLFDESFLSRGRLHLLASLRVLLMSRGRSVVAPL